MKTFFLTLDLEEWYHLEYLKDVSEVINSSQSYIEKVMPFIENITEKGIRLTVFVVGDTATKNACLIRRIADLGHEIACHSYSHNLVYRLTNKQFLEETLLAKKILEDITGKKVYGYRAPCFSMDNEKLDILWECGFKYDSSLIRFKDHKLYNVYDISDFENCENLVYKKNNNYIFEVPTYDLLGKSMPISGGGYFRLFPKLIFLKLVDKYMIDKSNFIFYIHPFELSDEPLNGLKRAGWKNYMRFEIGRKGNNLRLLDFLGSLLNQKFEFKSFEQYLKDKSS